VQKGPGKNPGDAAEREKRLGSRTGVNLLSQQGKGKGCLAHGRRQRIADAAGGKGLRGKSSEYNKRALLLR